MITNMPFAAFCNKFAAKTNVKIEETNYTFPDEYYEKARNLLKLLRERKPGFPNYPIKFIQEKFEDYDELISTLNEKLVDGEIPDVIPVYFAYNLYSEFDKDGNPIEGKMVGYNNLPEPLQNIIKVVSVYFMLLI